MAVNINLIETLKESLNHIDLSELEERAIGGELPRDILNISTAQLQQCYQVGINKLNDTLYWDAFDVFVFLISLDPFESRFYIGAGNALQYMCRFREALEYYDIAMVTNTEDPFPHVYAAKCWAALDDLASADDCLATAVMIAQENMPEKTEFIDSINNLYKQLHNGGRGHG